MVDDQIKVAVQLKQLFPRYVTSNQLTREITHQDVRIKKEELMNELQWISNLNVHFP